MTRRESPLPFRDGRLSKSIIAVVRPSPEGHRRRRCRSPGGLLLEGGVVGGNSISCPGHYAGVEGHLRYGVSAYGMVENYQCTEIPETSSRIGLSLQLGPDRWWLGRR